MLFASDKEFQEYAAGAPRSTLLRIVMDRMRASLSIILLFASNNADGHCIDGNTVSSLYAEFVGFELLPWVLSHPTIRQDLSRLKTV